ncbi:MAG: phosphate signaling complex protein PhoU [Rhodospirillales bacterium]|nr:phosphate signaling complex protein PhoU [Rhodospirillales bacterium]
MPTEHTVKSYDDELKRLDNLVAEMGGLAELQLVSAIESLTRRDPERAAGVAMTDARIDSLQAEIDQQAFTMLALRQPMARDLREIISALKTAGILERVGDYAKNVAKRTVAISESPVTVSTQTVARLGYLAAELIKEVIDAYLSRDVERAAVIRGRDRELDALYTSLFRELLTYMMEDPRSITTCTHLLFVAKNFERVGDYATNLAEIVQFMVVGERPPVERPKDDVTSYTVMANNGELGLAKEAGS